MNRTIAIAAGMALAGATLPGAATADGTGKWYGTVAVGMAFPGNGDGNTTDGGYGKVETEFDFDNGFGFSGGVGYDLSPLRVEGVLSWLKTDSKSVTTKSIETPDPDPGKLDNRTDEIGVKVDGDGYMSALSVMGNVWWDIDTGAAVTPFVGGGIGMTQLSERGDGSSNDDRVFAWQIGAGVSYDLGNGTVAQLGYRFFNPGEADLDGLNFEPGGIHLVDIGLRYSF